MRLLLVTVFLFSFLYGESGILEIRWPKPNAKHQKPSIPYPSVLTKGIKNTKLPVYLPTSYVYDKNMGVVSEKDFYTISFTLNHATLMVSGDRTYQESVSKNDPKFQALAKASSKIEFIQEEGIMSVDFNRHGVNYSLLVECDDPKIDKRCTQEGFLKDVYNKLIMVGGHP